MNFPHIRKNDPAIFNILTQEAKRQTDGLEMIPSENYVSDTCLEAMGSILTNKYSEGYPLRRYYGGNQYIDEIEILAQERAKKLFGVPYANVQPYSGSPANSAVQFATLNPHETLMGLSLTSGGHLTHGVPNVTFSGKYFRSVQYEVDPVSGKINYDAVETLAQKEKPKLIICGLTAYSYALDFKRFGQIADQVGAYLMADIAHIAGLIIAGAHQSPVPFAHIVTTTTHKTLRGPRGAMILVTKKGIAKDPDLPNKIDKAVFPGLQGGPHDHTTAAIAVALKEASTPAFRRYGRQIVKNAKALAAALKKEEFRLVGNGTENHLLLVDLMPTFGPGGGVFVQHALDAVGITVNKNTIPGEPSSPFYPSGIRLGTPALTTRGMKEKDMKNIAGWMARVCDCIATYRLPKTKEERKPYIESFKKTIHEDRELVRIRKEIQVFARVFPIFAW